jgi:hypothetical protein
MILAFFVANGPFTEWPSPAVPLQSVQQSAAIDLDLLSVAPVIPLFLSRSLCISPPRLYWSRDDFGFYELSFPSAKCPVRHIAVYSSDAIFWFRK